MAFGRGRMGGGDLDMDAAPSTGNGSEAGGLTAFIDQGSSFEGKLSFKDTVRIDGHFAGEISSENTLVVGETGEIEANIRSKTVIVSGSIHGDIVAARKVVLHKTARVVGDIESPSLVVEDGATLNGRLTMSTKEHAPPKAAGTLKAVDGGAKPPAAPAGDPGPKR
jgi:cytoskeletal protein CcmA (bactofilin family)